MPKSKINPFTDPETLQLFPSNLNEIDTRNASDVTNTPAGGIAATNVQDALNELDTKTVKTADHTKAAHDALLIDADTLDTYHAAGFARTTAGQTINVGSGETYTSIQSVLDTLALSPSLIGNVIIQLTSDITEDITIPTLIYNGFSLTIQGALQTVTSFTSSATTPAVPAAGTYGTIQIAGTPWVANAYQGLLTYTPAGTICPIKSNTNNTLYHPHTTDPTVGTTLIKQPQYTLTGKIICANDCRTTLKYLCITTASYPTIYLSSSSNIEIIESIVRNTNGGLNTGRVLDLQSRNFAELTHSVFYSESMELIRMNGLSYIESISTPCGFITNSASGGRLFNLGFLCSFYIKLGFILSIQAKGAGNEGVWSNIGCTPFLYSMIVDNFDTGLHAANVGFIITFGTTGIINCTTNQTPAAAPDPSYIG